MKYLTVSLWQEDNIDYDVALTDAEYDKLMSAFLAYWSENTPDYWDEDDGTFVPDVEDTDLWEGFFGDIDLDEFDPAMSTRIYDECFEEVRRSYMEWYEGSQEDAERDFGSCSWGYHPVIIYESEC